MDFYKHKKRNTVYEEATITQPPVKMDMRQKYAVEDENGNLSTVEDEKTQDENVDLTFGSDVEIIDQETGEIRQYRKGALVPDNVTIIYPDGGDPYCIDRYWNTIPLVPRFKWISSTEPFCDKYAFSVLGLIDEYAVAAGIIKPDDLEKLTEYQILKKVSEGSIPGVLKKKQFNAVLKELDETLSQYGVSVSAKKYGMQLPDDIYGIGVSSLTSKSTLSASKAAANWFVRSFPDDQGRGPKKISISDPDERTPFMMSVRSVIETLKFGNDDLYDDLTKTLEDAYKVIFNAPHNYNYVPYSALTDLTGTGKYSSVFKQSNELTEDEIRAMYPFLEDGPLEGITCYSIDFTSGLVFNDVHPFNMVVGSDEVKYTALCCVTMQELVDNADAYNKIKDYKMRVKEDEDEKTLEQELESEENLSSKLLLIEDYADPSENTAKQDVEIVGMRVRDEGDETRVQVIFSEKPSVERELNGASYDMKQRVTKREIKFAKKITTENGDKIYGKDDWFVCVQDVFDQIPEDDPVEAYRSKWYVELSYNGGLAEGTVLVGYDGITEKYKVTYGDMDTVFHSVLVEYNNRINDPVAASDLKEISSGIYKDLNDKYKANVDAVNAIDNIDKKLLSKDVIKKQAVISYTAMVQDTILKKLAEYNDSLEKTWDKIEEYEKYTGNSVFPSGEFITNSNNDGISDSESAIYNRLCRLLIPVYVGKGKVPKEITKNGGSYTKYVTKNEKVRFYEINFTDTGVYSRFRDNTKIQGESLLVGDDISRVQVFSNDDEYTLSTTISKLNDVLVEYDEGDIDGYLSSKDRVIGVNLSSTDIPPLNGDFNATLVDGMPNVIEIKLDKTRLGNYYAGLLNRSRTLSGIKITVNSVILMNTDMLISEKDNVSVEYEMPYLPADSVILRRAIIDYGPFQQEEGVGRSRGEENPDDLTGGFSPFPETSDDLKSLRKGIGIYEKAAILIKILKQVFSDSRVRVVNTSRSMETQKNMHMGGPSSEFLSWHNYGLAISIQIMTVDGKTLIKDGSDDAITLTHVAEEFTKQCREGKIGNPMNVVWCGTLATGPSLFDWEFLPIGVGHKDAYKFRDAVLSQKDPYVANAYVNVTKNGYVVEPNVDVSNMTAPYIVRGSDDYENGIKINGDVYVPPESVNNYVIPENLILKNIIDFVEMVQLKQASNGTSFVGAHDIVGWRLQNPLSFKQLMTYYAISGSYSSCRILMSSEYITRFKYLIDNYYENDPVEFVKEFLGEEAYKNIRVYPSNAVAGSYITLATGKMTMATYDVLPSMPYTNANMFGQQKADPEHMYIGEYDENGVFYQFDDYKKTDESVLNDYDSIKYEPPSIKNGEPVKPRYIESDISVIGRYDANGVPYAGDALRIHKQIADQIYNEYDSFRKAIEDGAIPLLYDNYEGSPNYESFDLLENEFGIIASQDEVPYSQMYDMYNRIAEMSKTGPSNADVKGNTTGNKSNDPDDTSVDGSNLDIYDPLVSTVELTGPRKPSMSAEHVEVEELADNVTIEAAVKQLLSGIKKPNVTDMT